MVMIPWLRLLLQLRQGSSVIDFVDSKSLTVTILRHLCNLVDCDEKCKRCKVCDPAP